MKCKQTKLYGCQINEQPKNGLCIGDTEIKQVQIIKYLCMVLTENRTYDTQIRRCLAIAKYDI